MPSNSDSEDKFVLRSDVRSGLKREFAFALKERASLPQALSRTRSGYSPPFPNPKRPKHSISPCLPPPLIEIPEASIAPAPQDAEEDLLLIVRNRSFGECLESREGEREGDSPATSSLPIEKPLKTYSRSLFRRARRLQAGGSKGDVDTKGLIASSQFKSGDVDIQPENGWNLNATAAVEKSSDFNGSPIDIDMQPGNGYKARVVSAPENLKVSQDKDKLEYSSLGDVAKKTLGSDAGRLVPAENCSSNGDLSTEIAWGHGRFRTKVANKVPKVKFVRRFTRSSLKVDGEQPVVETPAMPISKIDDCRVDGQDVLKNLCLVANIPHETLDGSAVEYASFDTGFVTEVLVFVDEKSGTVGSKVCMGIRFRKLKGSALKAVGDPELEDTTMPLSDKREGLVKVPVIFDDWNGFELRNSLPYKSARRFMRSSLEVLPIMGEEPDKIELRDSECVAENPTRRITRSMLKSDEASTNDDEPVGLNERENQSDAVNEQLGLTPKKKMELKMSKKIAVTKLPSNVRELLATGFLEGLPVKYATSTMLGKKIVLNGIIKDGSIVCFCNSCKGCKSVSAFQFEVHAGSNKKHPADFIFLENGRSLREILRACIMTPLDMLEATIQSAISSITPLKPTTCDVCKESFHSLRIGKFARLCDHCCELKQLQLTPSSSRVANKSRRLFSPSSVSNSSKKITQGRLTRKDLGLHKLVFMGGILPEGTEVGYYLRGKKLLEGYIKDSGIFCRCCNCVVSPSVFEAHAGRAQRRKPYNNIYTSNGVSLHELSVSLSKDRKLSASENDDLCSICADGGDLLCCDLCPRAFHTGNGCSLSSSYRMCWVVRNSKADWYCQYCQSMHQREGGVAHNDNAIAAGRVAGVDPIEQIFKRCIRIVKTAENDLGGCILCRCQDFSASKFSERTVLLCDQCEKEYHVGCLKDHNMADLKELPGGEWFCSTDCSRIYASLQHLLIRDPEPLESSFYDLISKKLEEKGLNKDLAVDIKWKLLSGKFSSADSKLLLSKAVSIFHESFDPIIDIVTGRDLIPAMVYGRILRDQDYGGMFCAILTVGSSIVSVGILRILGCDVAELPLVATSRESQGLGYFQALFSCIEGLLSLLKVKHFVLPAADEAESIWTNKFGFSKITPKRYMNMLEARGRSSSKGHQCCIN